MVITIREIHHYILLYLVNLGHCALSALPYIFAKRTKRSVSAVHSIKISLLCSTPACTMPDVAGKS